MPVVLYRVYAKNSLGMTVAKNWTLPSYYRAVDQKTIDLTLTGLADGEYTVGVVAENAYGGQSEHIECKVQISGDNAFKTLFARIAQLFRNLKDFFTHLFW